MAGATSPTDIFADPQGAASAPARMARGGKVALWLAGLVAFLLLAGCSNVARAAGGEISAGIANGFARLIFTLPDGAEPDVRFANSIVVIAFQQPLDISVDRLVASAPGYISVARRDPDGMAVRMALARRVTVNTMSAGEKLFVDLLPEGWVGLPPGLPQDVVDDLARRAREAEKHDRERQQLAKRAREKTVRVRVATLPTFTRYVFEVADLTSATTERNRDRFSLTFDAPLKFDLADAKAASPQWVAALEAETGNDNAKVRFIFSGKVDIRSFREDANYIVDISATGSRDRPPGSIGTEGGGESPTPRWSTGGEPRPPTSRASAPDAAVAAAQPPPPEIAAPKPQPPQALPSVPPAPPATAAAPSPPPVPSAASAERPALTPAPAADANAPIVAMVRRQSDNVRLVFPFRERTAAAVFRRADKLWLVFDSGAPLDLRRLKEDSGGAIRDATIMPSGSGQVVQIKLDRTRLTSIAADDRSWIVALGDVVLEPTAPLSITRTRSGNGQPVAIVPFQEPQRVHRLHDPEVGDTVLAVTAHGPARGFLKAQEFVEFRALTSTHGIALEAFADDVAVELAPERIVIARPGGLELTANVASASDAPAVAPYRPTVLNVQSWGFDRQADFLERRTALTHALADAPESRRTAARLDFARFYLARDMFAEAKGMLDTTFAGERDQEQLAVALVLRAIANIMLRREDLALKDLATPSIGNQHAAPLWRGVALSRNGRFADAREGFRNLETTTAELPVEFQRVAFQEAARCVLEVGDLAEAARRINELETIGVPYDLRPTTSILAGRVAEGLNRTEDALAAYRAAAGSTDQPAAAQGRLRLLTLRHGLKQIDAAETVEELERLTASWRGDETELEALQHLAHLYAEQGRFRDAFLITRVALSVFPRAQITRRIQDEAAATFDSVFLGDRGNALTPMEALALFYDFRTLTPAGRRGDEMIRRLVERLVAMDLLEQASELLQHQIDHRLQGALRAHVAARAAMVYLMHHKPDRALQALRATRMNELPGELRTQRLLLEARALSDSGRHDLAIEIIEGLQGSDVARLRVDIHWKARQWREAAEEIERMYGQRYREEAPFDETERADALRAAVGYALAEDMLGLERFREKYAPKMAEGPEGRMFQVITAPLPDRSAEFADIAKATASVDTLTAFLRDLRARYPSSTPAAGTAKQSGQS